LPTTLIFHHPERYLHLLTSSQNVHRDDNTRPHP
jgi:hypothetical protein